jgi:hypothetical protein
VLKKVARLADRHATGILVIVHQLHAAEHKVHGRSARVHRLLKDWRELARPCAFGPRFSVLVILLTQRSPLLSLPALVGFAPEHSVLLLAFRSLALAIRHGCSVISM